MKYLIMVLIFLSCANEKKFSHEEIIETTEIMEVRSGTQNITAKDIDRKCNSYYVDCIDFKIISKKVVGVSGNAWSGNSAFIEITVKFKKVYYK